MAGIGIDPETQSDATSSSIEEIETWHVDALKDFLKKRSLKYSGSKKELVALVYSAILMKVPVCPDAKTRNLAIQREMRFLLATEDEGDLPNPDSLDGWIGEENGMTQWPNVLLSDITIYLMQDHPGSDVDLQQRLLNEYKEGKAYRLYEGGWLKEIFFCPISSDSKYCFLKADCTHSMKIRDVPHKLWICCTKKGDIKSAYCTCTAGLGGSCIHITAMFFRVESAVRRGFAGADVCTSKPCVWDVPSKKTVIEPMRLTEMKFTAAKFQKESTRSLTDRRRQLFSPVAERHVTSDDSNREKMKGLLELLGPESCLSSFFEKECTTRDKSSEHEPSSDILSSDSVSVPTTATRQNLLLTLAQQCDSVESYLTKMPFLTENEVKEIEQATIGQSKSSIWIEERKGRITASNFYQVYTRVNSVISLPKKEQNVDNTLKLLMGYNKDLSGLKSIEYGRITEESAKEVFSASFEKDHLNASVIDCGLFVHKEKPYLAATPDALLSCSCCGEGVLEIKCPLSAADKFPNPDTVSYLLLDEESVKLKKNHAYYAQVQGQIVISNRKYCVFFVYTSKGTFSQTIYFDEAFWNKIVFNLDYFFRNFMVEELLFGALKKKIETDKAAVTKEKNMSSVLKEHDNLIELCPTCNKECLEESEIKRFGDGSICCDVCNRWFHNKCVGIKTSKTLSKLQSRRWLCDMCST